MLQNVPTAESLEEIALRLLFDAWTDTLRLIDDFSEAYLVEDHLPEESKEYAEEWDEYIESAQAEMGVICTNIQQSAELKLKSIICSISPYLLLLNGSASLRGRDRDQDFSDLRTLDAVDLPNAVLKLTPFNLPGSYIQRYAKLRRLRNQVTHLGSHTERLSPKLLINNITQQYKALWPDGRWLHRRTVFDGNSARNFFHDDKYSSVQSLVMSEISTTKALMDSETFKKTFGIKKSALKKYCPICMEKRARNWEDQEHPTAYQDSSSSVFCLMCETQLRLEAGNKDFPECPKCSKSLVVHHPNPPQYSPKCICASCGAS